MASACVNLNDPATGYECHRSGPSRLAPTNSANLFGGDDGVCVLVRACALVRAHARVRDVFAIYDNNI